jgi:tagatose 1,6-diphosphate aldolase
MMTIGKYRHLSRTTSANGHFVVMAIDHRTNLLEKLNQYAEQPLNDSEFVDFKQVVLSNLAPHSSAVLTDPAYGIGAGIRSGAIHGQLGLLAPIEVTDYGLHPSQREINFIPNWSVKKTKMAGGDGVKLLLPYHPEANNVEQKYSVVRQIIEDCATYDIPFFLEPIPYSLNSDISLKNAELLQINIEMCKTFSAMGVDVLKLPFPLDPKQSQDEGEYLSACQAVNDACSVPWALLSAGVDYDTFLKQAKIACQAGASGVIVGRAIWAEAVELQGQARSDFLSTVAIERMKELASLCAEYATAWHESVEAPHDKIDWYEDYQV